MTTWRLVMLGAALVALLWVVWNLGRRAEARRIEQALVADRFVRFDPLLRDAPVGEFVELGSGRLARHWSWPEGWSGFDGFRTDTGRCISTSSGILWPGQIACCPWEREASTCDVPLQPHD